MNNKVSSGCVCHSLCLFFPQQQQSPLLWLPFVISRRHRRRFAKPQSRILFTFQIMLVALQKHSKSRQGEPPKTNGKRNFPPRRVAALAKWEFRKLKNYVYYENCFMKI
jgi:hypothetical protein